MRVLQRARDAWTAGKPHTAWQILAEAGMAAHWPEFQRTALAHARRGFTRAMTRYTV